MRPPALRGMFAAVALALLALAPQPARAQYTSAPNWQWQYVLADTCAVANQDTSTVVDMTNHRNLTVMVKVTPLAGCTEPWAIAAIRAVGSYKKVPDSTSTCVLQLQPIADHSYVGAASGDSLAYGAWATVDPTSLANGEVQVRGARSRTKFDYPHTYAFELGNKGQAPRMQWVYFQSRVLSTCAGNYARVDIWVQKSN